jgi:hypothetical protein
MVASAARAAAAAAMAAEEALPRLAHQADVLVMAKAGWLPNSAESSGACAGCEQTWRGPEGRFWRGAAADPRKNVSPIECGRLHKTTSGVGERVCSTKNDKYNIQSVFSCGNTSASVIY